MVLPTPKGTITIRKGKKYKAISSKKTGKNTYTTVWQEIKSRKIRKPLRDLLSIR